MSRTRIVLMLVVAGSLSLAGSPQAQAARIKTRATADPVAQYIASLLSNSQGLIAANSKFIAQQNSSILKLLSGRGNAAALKADIARLQGKIDIFTQAIVQTQAYTPILVNVALLYEANPTLKAQFALLNRSQQIATSYFVARPSATPFAV